MELTHGPAKIPINGPASLPNGPILVRSNTVDTAIERTTMILKLQP